MMQVNSRTEYALRCLLRIAQQTSRKALSITEIAKDEHLSKTYVEQILLRLKRAGLVNSARGTHGGYILARLPEEISIGEVVRTLEGIPFHNTCGRFNDTETDCGHREQCSLRPVWSLMEKQIWSLLDRTKLRHLMAEEKTVESTLLTQLSVVS